MVGWVWVVCVWGYTALACAHQQVLQCWLGGAWRSGTAVVVLCLERVGEDLAGLTASCPTLHTAGAAFLQVRISRTLTWVQSSWARPGAQASRSTPPWPPQTGRPVTARPQALSPPPMAPRSRRATAASRWRRRPRWRRRLRRQSRSSIAGASGASACWPRLLHEVVIVSRTVLQWSTVAALFLGGAGPPLGAAASSKSADDMRMLPGASYTLHRTSLHQRTHAKCGSLTTPAGGARGTPREPTPAR